MNNFIGVILRFSIIFLFSNNLFCQIDSEAVERDNFKKEYSSEIERVSKNSITVTFKIEDFDIGGTCGSFKSAGVFLCEVQKCSNKKLQSKNILVIIQCSNGKYPDDFFKKGGTYSCKITPDKAKFFVHAAVARFDLLHLKEYYNMDRVDNLNNK